MTTPGFAAVARESGQAVSVAAGVAPLRIVILAKQVPRAEELDLDEHGHLRRSGVTQEINPYCRRAIAAGIALAHASAGRSTLVVLGPPSAEDLAREAVAAGVDDAVIVSDPAFAGSDTLATAAALAAAIGRLGRVDVILAGRNSVDADTGQLAPELAQLLDLPFAGAARTLSIHPSGHSGSESRRLPQVVANDGESAQGDGSPSAHPLEISVGCERDDGWMELVSPLPAVIAVAERLCAPAQADVDARAAVAPDRLSWLSAAMLGAGPWGAAGSPTRVGPVQSVGGPRQQRILEGPISEQVAQAVTLLAERELALQNPTPSKTVVASLPRQGRPILVVIEPGREPVARELLGEAALLASARGGSVHAVFCEDSGPWGDARPPGEMLGQLSGWGADEATVLDSAAPEAVAVTVINLAKECVPWAVLAPATSWGREVAARAAGALAAGLVADAVGLESRGDRLIAWKPAFGGQVVAAIESSSATQLVTVRPGVLSTSVPRASSAAQASSFRSRHVHVAVPPRVRLVSRRIDVESEELAVATTVVGIGMGVAGADLPVVRGLAERLGAAVAGTRKMADRDLLPRASQVGLTGRSIAPARYLAVGLSGRFTHLVGVRGARTILAINPDRGAAVFQGADIGIVGTWQEALPLLVDVLALHPPGYLARVSRSPSATSESDNRL